ncbi:DUF4192 family protein [Kitasatospora mediocidica]|uniref:DUF4192 family protein n=1 Tax=Kitasatospora mediocidica TaxID=58352 RepID=UPI0005656008|nr:DUF4192 family protein [Kitasatospora mediocidica]
MAISRDSTGRTPGLCHGHRHLTLLGLTAWAADDEVTARIALHGACEIAPGYLLAELCLENLNSRVSFDKLGETLRQKRVQRLGYPAH